MKARARELAALCATTLVAVALLGAGAAQASVKPLVTGGPICSGCSSGFINNSTGYFIHSGESGAYNMYAASSGTLYTAEANGLEYASTQEYELEDGSSCVTFNANTDLMYKHSPCGLASQAWVYSESGSIISVYASQAAGQLECAAPLDDNLGSGVHLWLTPCAGASYDQYGGFGLCFTSGYDKCAAAALSPAKIQG